MNTKNATDDVRIPQTDSTPEEATELDTEQMEKVTGGVNSVQWSGSGGDGDEPDRGHT